MVDVLWEFSTRRVRVSSRDPPYLSPLLKHLCKVRNKTAHRGNQVEKIIRQDKINTLIRINQVNAVNNEQLKHNRGSKGWWDRANRITGKDTKQPYQLDDFSWYHQHIFPDHQHWWWMRLQCVCKYQQEPVCQLWTNVMYETYYHTWNEPPRGLMSFPIGFGMISLTILRLWSPEFSTAHLGIKPSHLCGN